MIFDGLPLAHLDQVVLAVHDILHGDAWLRTAFGGHTLAGTGSIAMGTTSLAGAGTSWASGVDALAKGDRITLGDQVATVASDPTDTALEIQVAHADGLIGEEIHKSGRGLRVDRLDAVLDVAMPYWTVGAGALPDFESAIGRLATSPEVQITFVYESGPHPLGDRESSWAGLLQHVVGLCTDPTLNRPRLGVARFGGKSLGCRFISAAGGATPLPGPDGSVIFAPAIALKYEGGNPITSTTVPQEW